MCDEIFVRFLYLYLWASKTHNYVLHHENGRSLTLCIFNRFSRVKHRFTKCTSIESLFPFSIPLNAGFRLHKNSWNLWAYAGCYTTLWTNDNGISAHSAMQNLLRGSFESQRISLDETLAWKGPSFTFSFRKLVKKQ